MRRILVTVLALLPFAAEAQDRSRVVLRFPPERAAAPGGMRAVRPARVPGVWGWGWGWNPGWAQSGPLRVIVEQAPEKEKPAPPYIVNKEYTPERHTPRMTEVAAAQAAPAQVEWRKCSVRLKTGESFDVASCAEVDDTLLVKAETGRRYRFSRDLIAALR